METVKLLLELGANVDAEDKHGRTPLHADAGNGHEDIVKLMLESGANVHAQNNNGCMPLHLAVVGAHVETARWGSLGLDRWLTLSGPRGWGVWRSTRQRRGQLRPGTGRVPRRL